MCVPFLGSESPEGPNWDQEGGGECFQVSKELLQVCSWCDCRGRGFQGEVSLS